MLKKTIYPKTKRVPVERDLVVITEKLDGSNLAIFKFNNVLHIAQRNTIISIEEIEECKNLLYKGLYQWLKDNRDRLNTIRNNSVIVGEWLGMGKLKYPALYKRFYMFAKANIDTDYNLYNIYYDHELFIYPFENLQIPTCIGIVPIIYELEYIPHKDTLDVLYSKYTEQVGRDVEGFVINNNNFIEKYVRLKNGKLQEHFDRGE